MPLLAAHGLTKSYGGVRVLDAVDFDRGRRRSPRAGRRKRRRQIHADQDPRRCGAARRRTRRTGRRAAAAGRPAGGARPRPEPRLPGIHARPGTRASPTIFFSAANARTAVPSPRGHGARRRSASSTNSARTWPATAPVRTPERRPAADGRDRARARRRGEGARLRRAVGEPVGPRGRPAAGRDAAAARAGPRASSTSRIGSRRCSRSPIASPCCATAAASRPRRPPGSIASSSSAGWSDATCPRSSRRATPARATSCSTSRICPRRRDSTTCRSPCERARLSGWPAWSARAGRRPGLALAGALAAHGRRAIRRRDRCVSRRRPRPSATVSRT